jgi:hypothetical protein
MTKGVSVTERVSRGFVEHRKFYTDEEIAELFPDHDNFVRPLLERAQAAEAEVERLKAQLATK